MSRIRLSNRRAAHTFQIRHYGTDFVCAIGTYDDGKPAEVFVVGGKSGVDVQTLANDGAILISLALQHGASINDIKHSLSRNPDNTPQSFIGVLVDAMEQELKLNGPDNQA